MRGFEVIRDVTSPLGLKSLNEQLKMLHFRTMNITDKDIRPESIGSIHIQVESIDGHHIKPKSITTEHIKADFITTNHLEAVTARIGHLEATSATISDLNAAVARIRDLEADRARIDELYAIKANITDLDAIHADITDLRASKADIEQLDVVNADIVRLTADVGSIKNLLAGNLTAANFQAGAIKAGDAIIADAAISDAMIANVSVSKLLAGDISTNKFRLVSDSGNLLIYDNTIQIQDDNKVRVQIGKDASGDYSMYVWDSDGKLMFDATGLKKDAIKEAIIRDDMIAGDANIDAKKINIRSLFTEMNESEEVLKSSKIVLDTEEQTLDIAFANLKTKVDENIEVTSSYGTKLSVIEGQIQSKIWQTDITQALNSAKQYTDDAVTSTVTVIDDKFTQVTQTIDGIQVSIGDLHSEIDNIDQEILAVDNKVVTLSATVDGVSSEITSVKQNYLTKTDAGNIYATQTAVSSLEQSVNGLSSRVSSVETNYLTKTDAQDIYTTKTKTSELEQSLDGVALRVTSVESVVSEHESTLSEAITSINALQGQIELKVEQTDIEKAINEIEVGGRNLLPNSGEEKTNDGSQWRPEFLRTYDLAPIFEKYGLDREYSLSFELKSADTSKNNRIQIYMQSGSGTKYNFINKTVEVTEEYQRFVFEGLKPTKTTGEHNTAHLSFYGTYDTGNIPIVRKIKLELGNKATDWTPAPEDIDQAINTVDTKIDNKVSEINITLDGITQRVSSVESSVSTIDDEVTSLETRIQTAEQKITPTAIVSTVRQSTAYQNDLDGKVSKNNIISEINQTAEQIKIQASKIKLEGLVTANSNFKVLTDGSIEAKNAIIEGKITAKSGSIGSWNISSNYIMPADEVAGIGVGTTPTAFWAGYDKTNNSYQFRVTRDGVLTARKGTIGDWTVDRNIYAYNNGLYTTLKSGGNVAFAAGAPTHYDTSGANLQIYHDGRVRASKDGVRRAEIAYDRISFYTETGALAGEMGSQTDPVAPWPGVNITSTNGNVIRLSTTPSNAFTSSIDMLGYDKEEYPYITMTTKSSNVNHNTWLSLQADGSGLMMFGPSIHSLATGINTVQASGYIALQAPGVYVEGSLRPWETGTYSLGSSSYRWTTAYLTSNPNVSSDVRLKENIQSIPDDLIEELKEIQPKMFQQYGKWHFGYIAQDVERALYKYALKKVGWENAQEYVKEFEVLYKDESYLSLIYAEVAILKEAEMQRRIDELEKKLKTLEEQISN